MDKRIEAFLTDILALEGKHSNLVREAVRAYLAKCERQFRKAEEHDSMKNRAVETCDRLCRARIVEEIQKCKGTLTAVHLKIVLSVIDGPGRLPLKSE